MSFVPIWFMLAMPVVWLAVLPFDFLVVTLMLWIVNRITASACIKSCSAAAS